APPPLRLADGAPTLGALPSNLPVHLTTFVGREQDLAAIRQALATARLLTLAGAGGCGKTRLAVEVAVSLAAAGAAPGLGEAHPYADGVWLVALEALTDPTLVPQAVASVMGVPEEPGRPL